MGSVEMKGILVEDLDLHGSGLHSLLDLVEVKLWLLELIVGFIFVVKVHVEVHEDWWSWGSESKLDGVGEGEVDSDDVAEVDVVEMWLSLGEDSVDGAEGAGDVESPGREFDLVLGVVELDSVLVDELAEEVAGDLEVLGEALWSDLLWPEFSADLLELLGDEVEDLLPSGLVGGVLHDVGDESVLASEISSEVGNDVVDGLMLVVLLEESLKSKTELEEVGSHHTSLIGEWLTGVWFWAVLILLSAESVESGDFNSSEVLKIFFDEVVQLDVGEHFSFLKIYYKSLKIISLKKSYIINLRISF